MVVLFVILTILAFLTVDYFVQKSRAINEKTGRLKYRKPVLPRVLESKPQPASGYWAKLNTQQDEGVSARQS